MGPALVVVVSGPVVVVGADVVEVVLVTVVVLDSTEAELQAVITARKTKIWRLTERRLGD